MQYGRGIPYDQDGHEILPYEQELYKFERAIIETEFDDDSVECISSQNQIWCTFTGRGDVPAICSKTEELRERFRGYYEKIDEHEHNHLKLYTIKDSFSLVSQDPNTHTYTYASSIPENPKGLEDYRIYAVWVTGPNINNNVVTMPSNQPPHSEDEISLTFNEHHLNCPNNGPTCDRCWADYYADEFDVQILYESIEP